MYPMSRPIISRSHLQQITANHIDAQIDALLHENGSAVVHAARIGETSYFMETSVLFKSSADVIERMLAAIQDSFPGCKITYSRKDIMPPAPRTPDVMLKEVERWGSYPKIAWGFLIDWS